MPRIIETILSESELVTAAIAFGEGQFELGVIIKPSSDTPRNHYDELKLKIWPLIVEAGDRMDDHARISSKNAIIIVPHNAILPKSLKGTIKRKEVYKMLNDDIAKAYQDLENHVYENSPCPLSIDNLEQDLRKLMKERLRWGVPVEEWQSDDDLFELGLNSLQAVQLRRLLRGALKFTDKLATAERITPDFIYQNPSIKKLANALKGSDDSRSSTSPPPYSLIDDFVKLHSIKQTKRRETEKESITVLLTGTTGSLGTHLLSHLANIPSVGRIICLNGLRLDAKLGTDPYVRQRQLNRSKFTPIHEELWPKIEFLQSDAALPFLGLPKSTYVQICGEITYILHSAWPMDFRRKLSSFQNQFPVLQNLLGLTRDINVSLPFIIPKLLFDSSIAVVGQYPLVQGEQIIPEISVHDEKWINSIGYA